MPIAIKSVRLSESLRSTIRNAIMAKWKELNPPPPTEAEVSDTAARALWKLVYGKLAPTIKKLPADMIVMDECISATVDGVLCEFTCKDKMPAVSASWNPPPVAQFEGAGRPKFYKEYMAGMEAWKEWQEKHDTFRSEISTIVGSARTMKQLYTMWPDVASLMSEGLGEVARCNLPALQVDEINKALGLGAPARPAKKARK